MINFYLHDGLIFYDYKSYREHFESCPKCKPFFDYEKEVSKEFAKLLTAKLGRNHLFSKPPPKQD